MIRVLVVEDSLVQRAHLVRFLEADGDIAVVGQAGTASEGVEMAIRQPPDVVILDLHLPDRSGNYVIEQIMARAPAPILVLSSTVVGPQSAAAIDALVAGALDAVPKPAHWTAEEEAAIRRSVRNLSKVTVIRHATGRSNMALPVERSGAMASVVALAASTGGPAALARVLGGLHGLSAPVLIVQHIHPEFVAGLAAWMTRVSALPVHLAEHGQQLVAGHVYIGPGNVHLRLAAHCRVSLDPAPSTLHRPSADELFTSLAEHAGDRGVGVIMTGMGSDGATGLLALRQCGGRTFGQDEASCAVFGMPQAAHRLKAVGEMVALGDIADAVVRTVRGNRP